MFAVRSLGLVVLACCLVVPALTQEQDDAVAGPFKAKGRYVVMPPKLEPDFVLKPESASLQSWNGSFTSGGTNYTYNMVGTAPSTGTSTTVTSYIVPIKIVISSRRTKTTYDPAHVLSNGKTVIANTVASPIFDATTTYTQGGVDVGTTQYIDAFQRANFWGTAQSQPNYHLLLGGPTVLAEQTLSPSSSYGRNGSPFGFTAGLVDINWFDSQLPGIISKFSQIQPNTLVIFLTYDVYLTQSGSCCVGGYHSSEGSVSNPQSYAQFS
jgi:hypothetical protein